MSCASGMATTPHASPSSVAATRRSLRRSRPARRWPNYVSWRHASTSRWYLPRTTPSSRTPPCCVISCAAPSASNWPREGVQAMWIDLPDSWLRVVGDELDQPYFQTLAAFVDEERQETHMVDTH